ncbi:MAG: hypothetical protein ACOC5T_02240 [Elusimicrobiota bacterium]
MISVKLKLNTDAGEQKVFDYLYQKLVEGFQDFEVEVCGRNETIKKSYKWEPIKEKKG